MILMVTSQNKNDNDISLNASTVLSFKPSEKDKQRSKSVGVSADITIGSIKASIGLDPTNISDNEFGVTYTHDKDLKINYSVEKLKNHKVELNLFDECLSGSINSNDTDKQSIIKLSIDILKAIKNRLEVKNDLFPNLSIAVSNDTLGKDGLLKNFIHQVDFEMKIKISDIDVTLSVTIKPVYENGTLTFNPSITLKFSKTFSITFNLIEIKNIFNGEGEYTFSDIFSAIISELSVKMNTKEYVVKSISEGAKNETQEVRRKCVAVGGM